MIGLHLALIVSTITIKLSAIQAAGTTPYIKDVFIGRCWQYQNDKQRNKVAALKENINCNDLWTAFYKSFASRNECDIKDSSYQAFFSMLNNSVPITNALFWSGSGELVHDFTFINDDYIVLEDTMTGYLLNGLTWCGSNKSADGMNYTSCNDNGKKCNAMYPAWFHASANFARRASNQATVLLNASRSGNKDAYYEKSFFRSVEMPRLLVDYLKVLVASNVGVPIREQCGEKSLVELESDAKVKNMQVTCEDQPSLVLRVFCLKFPGASQCSPKQYFDDKYTEKEDEVTKWRSVAIGLMVLCACATIGVLLIYFWNKHRKKSVQISGQPNL